MTIQQKDYDPALAQGAANTVALPQTITDATSSALAVGANGATNPVFQIDASASSVATGLKVAGAAAGTAPTLQVISSGTNEGLDIKPKAAGNIRVFGDKKVIVSGSGATVTLTKDQSGSLCLFDRAAGIVFTLPANTPGMVFDFLVTTTITSNAAKVITAAGTELLIGTVSIIDGSQVMTSYVGNGSTHISVSMNGTTTGGVLGTYFRFYCLTSTRWLVSGLAQGSGTIATPFATS